MRLKSVKVKTAKNRTISSSKWLQRQLNDKYVIMSKAEGYRSRAAYKLLEINEKFRLIKPNSKILDLGAAPGGWSQVAEKLIGKKNKIVAVDLLDMPEIPNVDFIKGDFCDKNIVNEIISKLDGKPDLIISDMAPNTTGHQKTDHLRIMDLCERVIIFAIENLNQGGSIVVKIFQGGAESDILKLAKKHFTKVKHFKPESSRKDSAEIYLVAQGFVAASEKIQNEE